MRAKPHSTFVKAKDTLDGIEGIRVIGYEIKCIACGNNHIFYTLPGYYKSEGRSINWNFDGNLEMPTFTPSLNQTTGSLAMSNYKDGDIPPTRCHSIVTNGKIQYCGDCTHSYKGQTIDLPEIE
jgi:hypothetical protein